MQLTTTRVPQVRSYPPRGWPGAGVGVGMLGSRGFSWFLGFKVSWFQSLLVAKSLGFNVSWFQSFKVSKIQYYPYAISCFLEDIESIFKISKSNQTDIHDVRCQSVPTNLKLRFTKFEISNNHIR